MLLAINIISVQKGNKENMQSFTLESTNAISNINIIRLSNNSPSECLQK